MNIKNNYNLIVFKNINELNKYLLDLISSSNKKSSIILSWGNSLNKLFSYLSDNFKVLAIRKIFLSDERIVSYQIKKSNRFKLLKIFNKNKKHLNKNLVSIPSDFNEMSQSKLLNIMEKNLNESEQINTAILSVAQDGHVASLLNKKYTIKNSSKNFILLKEKSENFNRVTFKLEYFASLNQIILIIVNKKKSHLLKMLKEDKPSSLIVPFMKLIKSSNHKVLILTNKQCYKFI